MEVKVLEHEGISNDNILMIRAGPMRRQAKLNAGLPFQFPSLPLNANPFKVEVFQPLGSKSLILSPDAEVYSVNLPATDHGSWSKIQLEIKDMPVGGTGGTGGTEGQANTVEPLPPREPASDDLIDDGSKKAQNDESLRRVEKAKAEAALAAKGYLHKHNLVNFVQEMLTTVLKEKPFDPYCYMRDYARGQLAPKQPEPPAAADEAQDNFGEDEDLSIRAVDPAMPQDVSGPRVPVKFQVDGLDYHKLLADSSLTSKAVAVIRSHLATEVGLDDKCISMELSAGSVKVDATLVAPDMKTAQTVQQTLFERKETVRANITKALTDTEGMSNATDGTITCGDIQVLSIQEEDIGEAGEDNTKWYQRSQQGIVLDGDSAMLTISEDPLNSRIRFDVFIPSKNPPYRWVVCSQAEFDACCADATGASQTEKMINAITRLFTEELEENRPPVDSFESTPEPRAVSASVSPESEIAHQLAQWATDGCAQEAVSQEEEKVIVDEDQGPLAETNATRDGTLPEKMGDVYVQEAQSRELPAEFTPRELPLGMGAMAEATTTASASAPPLEAKPPEQPKPQNPRPGGAAAKAATKAADDAAAAAAAAAAPADAGATNYDAAAPAAPAAELSSEWQFQPSVGSWLGETSPRSRARALEQQAGFSKNAAASNAAAGQDAVAAANAAAAPNAASTPGPLEETSRQVKDAFERGIKDGSLQKELPVRKASADERVSNIRADNERLVDKNEALRAEIARLKAKLGDSGAAAAAPAAASAAPAAQAPPAPPQAVPAAKKEEAPLSSEAGKPLDPLLFDDVFDKCVGELYQEHKKKNEELRASYDRLSQENTQLVQEQDRMKQMLLRLCYGLEGMATDIRAAVGEPTFKPPMKSNNLEAENKDLRQNIVVMYEANRKLRTDNAVLCSELSSRGASRAASQMTMTNASPLGMAGSSNFAARSSP